MNVYTDLAQAIIKHQEGIIGPLAWSQATEVPGIEIKEHDVILKANGKKILELLVNQYKTLFGQASVEACKDAIKEAQIQIADKDLPDILK